LHVVRQLAQAATLVRAQRGKLVATPLGKSMLSDAKQGSLLAILFHLAFWHMDLGYFGRGLLGSWPQADAGVVLWSLSVCANDWQSAEKLTRLCTIPEPAMFSETWDRTPYAMEAKILRPLLWFGLLEHRSEKVPSGRFGEHHFYRKAELFDRLLDPISAGLVESFNRPSGNATGVTLLTTLMEPKRLGLLRELVPGVPLVGVLLNPRFPTAAQQLQEIVRISPTFEFMVGAGPSISRPLNGEDQSTTVSAAFSLDFMFWPTPNVGWFVEPTWTVNPRNGQQSFAASVGLLIGISQR
jgi:hypothetical protein